MTKRNYSLENCPQMGLFLSFTHFFYILFHLKGVQVLFLESAYDLPRKNDFKQLIYLNQKALKLNKNVFCGFLLGSLIKEFFKTFYCVQCFVSKICPDIQVHTLEYILILFILIPDSFQLRNFLIWSGIDSYLLKL